MIITTNLPRKSETYGEAVSHEVVYTRNQLRVSVHPVFEDDCRGALNIHALPLFLSVLRMLVTLDTLVSNKSTSGLRCNGNFPQEL